MLRFWSSNAVVSGRLFQLVNDRAVDGRLPRPEDDPIEVRGETLKRLYRRPSLPHRSGDLSDCNTTVHLKNKLLPNLARIPLYPVPHGNRKCLPIPVHGREVEGLLHGVRHHCSAPFFQPNGTKRQMGLLPSQCLLVVGGLLPCLKFFFGSPLFFLTY